VLGSNGGAGLEPLDHLSQQSFLALEVVVDQPLRDPGFPGDVLGGGVAHPLTGEQLQGRVEQLLAPDLCLFSPPGGRLSNFILLHPDTPY
jgi:hypothetical protein